MSYIKTIDVEGAHGELKDIYEELRADMGMIPAVLKVQSLRSDLLSTVIEFVEKLMDEEHKLSATTKELIATFVSKLNSCAY